VADLQEILETLEAAAELRRLRKIDFFTPYPKQQAFFDMGLGLRERLLMAGNQNGKSYAGGAEMAYHLTGEYPDWWLGRRFRHPVKAWGVGQTGTLVRDVQQTILCGNPGVEADFGTGMIPRSAFRDKPSLARGVTDAYDTIQVEHKTDGVVDGISTLSFKSYEQGRAKFQGATLHLVWCDEEPPEDIYQEILTRTAATGGMVYVTFTPLLGMSNVVIRFLNEPSPDRGVVTMTIDDALHISPEQRQKIIDGYAPHEREARARGTPLLGSGRIFTEAEANISEPAIEDVPKSWAKLWSIDFGIGHPFAACLWLWDRDNDVIHLHHVIRMADKMPSDHARAMQPLGAAVPVAWPHDGNNRSTVTGAPLAAAYRQEGLAMLPTHATWPEGGVSTETGIIEMQMRMATGRLKVANHLSMFFEEYRLYHRKDGLIVKLRDDILSAARIGIMAKRFARAVPLGSEKRKRRNNQIADGVDFDYF
jgi:phage terminase large subunit-like protein